MPTVGKKPLPTTPFRLGIVAAPSLHPYLRGLVPSSATLIVRTLEFPFNREADFGNLDALAAITTEAEFQEIEKSVPFPVFWFTTVPIHPAIPFISRLLKKDGLGEPSGIRIKSHWLGKVLPFFDPVCNDIEKLLHHPLFNRFPLAERWYGTIREVFCRPGNRSLSIVWKHLEPGRYGIQEIIWSPEWEEERGSPFDERWELTGTCGILWCENLYGVIREGPKIRLKRGSTVTVEEFGPGQTTPGIMEMLERARQEGARMRGMALADACLESLKTGKPVSVV